MSSPALDRLTAIDFETTGKVPGFDDEPWQIGFVSVIDGEPDLGSLEGHWLHVDSERPFNRYAPGRHARIRDILHNSPSLTDLWPTLSPRLANIPLVAHNAPFERNVLSKAFPLYPLGPWIDTLQLARKAWPALPSHKLEYLVDSLGLKQKLQNACPTLAPHDARYDALAAALVLSRLLRQPGWCNLGLDDLLDLR